MKTYTVNINSHIRHLWLLLLLLILLPVSVYFLLIHKHGFFDLQTAVMGSVIVLIIFILPMIILHLNYYFLNRRDSFSYDESNGTMIFRNDNKEYNFHTNEIISIVCYKSWPMSENRVAILPWDIYNYALVKLKNGNVIKISSLLVYEFDKLVQLDNIEIKKTFYAWIS